MRQKFKESLVWVVPIFLLWLAMHYWDSAAGFAETLLGVASPLVTGFCIAYVVNILMSFYEGLWVKGLGEGRAASARTPVCMVLALGTVALFAYGLLRMVVPEVWNASGILVERLAELVKMGQDWVVRSDLLSSDQISQISAALEEWTSTVVSWVTASVASVVSGAMGLFSSVANLFIALVFSIHLLLNKEHLVGQLHKVIDAYLPKGSARVLYRVGGVANDSFQHYISGQCIEAVVLGTLCALGMMLLRMPYAVMVGSVVGVTALIPFAGAYIGAIVGAIMIATESIWQALLFVGYLIVLQQLENNLIYPQVAGRVIGLPGIWIIAAVTVGGGLGGIAGMVLAVPLTATFYQLFKDDLEARTADAEHEGDVEQGDVAEG